MRVQPSLSLDQLRGLLEVGRVAREEGDLPRLCDEVAAAIATMLGFGTVVVNIARPAWDDYEVVTVHGGELARATLLGNTTSSRSWLPYLDERFRRRGAHFVPHERIDWQDSHTVYVPELDPVDDPDAWHPDDALIVALERSDGRILGFISVDEPETRRRPTDEELDLLVALARHVAAAIEAAQDAVLARQHQASLERLLAISSRLAAVDSVDDVLDAVASGIRTALGFDKVAVALADEEGSLAVRASAGWDDPGALDIAMTRDDLWRVLDPAYEIEGCTLMPREVAEERVGGRGSNYASRRNGTGVGAWDRHWLVVPLVATDGSLLGFVWADDPVDHLLPSRERLQALRTFANHAAVALRSATDVELLSARNAELQALHETAFGLLERLELDRVLRAIVESAGRLARTPNSYLYLVDPQAGRLRMRVGTGRFAENVDRVIAPGEGASGRVLETGETVVVEDYRTWENRQVLYDAAALGSVAAVPLRVAGELAGVIGLARDEVRPFDEAQVALLERFARMASLALENARLYEALARSEELHRHVVEHATELICLLDLEGRMIVASPSTAATLGVPMEELIGSHFGRFVHPDDVAAANANFAKAVGGEASSLTVRAVRPDGRAVVLEATAVLVPARESGASYLLATCRDVTERLRLEEQLRQAQKMESVGRLAGGVAHDFNNLLTAIRGYAELLILDLPDNPEARESAEQIARAAERAAALTGQLLAFSRKQVLRPQELDLNAVISELAPMLARMLRTDVVLSTALAEDLWRTHADPAQVEQVVLNLAVNARDAMPTGGRLVLRTENVVRDGEEHVALVVSDTGTGMDDDTAERAFEPFFTTKDVGEGTGLGLATVHGIVAQSGGRIEVETTLGAGTTFTILLPRATS